MEILYKLLFCFTMMVCITQVAITLGSIAGRGLNFPLLTRVYVAYPSIMFQIWYWAGFWYESMVFVPDAKHEWVLEKEAL